MSDSNRFALFAIVGVAIVGALIGVGIYFQPKYLEAAEPSAQAETEIRSNDGGDVTCYADCEVTFGTGESALAGTPTQAASATQQNREWLDLLAQRRMAYWAIWLAGFTGVGLVILAGTLLEGFQAARAAGTAAAAAAAQTQILTRQHEAKVWMDQIHMTLPTGPDRERAIVEFPIPREVWIRTIIKYHAPLGAEIKDSDWGYYVGDDLPAEPFYNLDLRFPLNSQTKLRPGEGHVSYSARGGHTFTDEDLRRLNTDNAKLWFWTRIVVEDPVGGTYRYRGACYWAPEPNPSPVGDNNLRLFQETKNKKYVGEEYTPPKLRQG